MIFEKYWNGNEVKLKVVFEGTAEAWEVFQKNLQQVIDNPRWWLDNLETLPEYQIPQTNYGKKRKFYERTSARGGY